MFEIVKKRSQQSFKSIKLLEDRYNNITTYITRKTRHYVNMRALSHWYLHFIQLRFDSDYCVTSAEPLLGEQIKRQNVDKYCVKKWQILASLKNWQILRPLLTTTTASQLKERKSALSKCPLTSASQCCVKVLCKKLLGEGKFAFVQFLSQFVIYCTLKCNFIWIHWK